MACATAASVFSGAAFGRSAMGHDFDRVLQANAADGEQRRPRPRPPAPTMAAATSRVRVSLKAGPSAGFLPQLQPRGVQRRLRRPAAGTDGTGSRRKPVVAEQIGRQVRHGPQHQGHANGHHNSVSEPVARGTRKVPSPTTIAVATADSASDARPQPMIHRSSSARWPRVRSLLTRRALGRPDLSNRTKRQGEQPARKQAQQHGDQRHRQHARRSPPRSTTRAAFPGGSN